MNQDGKKNEDFSLQALRAGDRAEFARLVERYSTVIYRLALKMLKDPQDAEDVLQETFMKAFKALNGFDGRSSLSTWLYRIAANEALMLIRKRKRVTSPLEDEPDEADEALDAPVQVVDWRSLPESELMDGEARSVMEDAVQQLSPALRAVFLLRDVEGLSTLETAEALSLSEEAVKTRLSRARWRLRELLSHYYAERLRRTQATD